MKANFLYYFCVGLGSAIAAVIGGILGALLIQALGG